MAPTVFLSAGEPSGDLHGAAVTAALRRRWPDARLLGLGGRRMAGQGVELVADPDRLAVMGFAEVVTSLPFFARLFRRVRKLLRTGDVDLVLPIDYPGFNMRLARGARRADIPVLYYIAPQVWAWHRSRMAKLAECADRIAVVLPFEESLFRDAGARARFVGHPLLDLPSPRPDRDAFCRELGLEPGRPILALFPGSRKQEVERHLELFTAAAARVRRRQPAVQPVIAASPALSPAVYGPTALPLAGDGRSLLGHARAALVKSGTTTLETALAGVPMAIAYRTHPVSYWLAQRLVEVDHIGLVNLVYGDRLAPEFVQRQATPTALAEALLPLLDEDSPDRRTMMEGLRTVRERLKPPDDDAASVAARVAGLAAELLPAAARGSGRR